MDRVDAQKAFRKPSALIEINIGIGRLRAGAALNRQRLWIGSRLLHPVVMCFRCELARRIISLHCHGHEFVFGSSSIRRKTFIAI
jgi:hypothetical protein